MTTARQARGIVTRAANLLRRVVRRSSGGHDSTVGIPISDAALGRLVSLGLDHEELIQLDFREPPVEIPDGWRERGNRLYVASRATVRPDFLIGNASLIGDLSGALIVLATTVDNFAAFLVSGNEATVYIGPECWLPNAQLHCGDGSTVILRRLVTCTWGGRLDARNGGRVFADDDQLWASDVYIATDDMHAVRSVATGERLNRRGGRIRFGRHVWLGMEAVVTGDVELGANSIVAMRSVVRHGAFPASVVLAGTPAKVVRTGTTWSRDDLP